ncbi:MAG: Nramp family divalent metal transporter [Planctomycetota bacterium]
MPGLLVAATGLGAGDLITASLAGSSIGVGLLWAVLVGALLKWLLNEGLARWQLATGTTLVEGWVTHLGPWVRNFFLAYFLLWSFVVGGALISACGVAGAGLLPIGDLETSKVVWGIVHSLVGLLLVRAGGFRLFQAAMAVSIAIMFVTVLLTAVLIGPDWAAVGAGLVRPAFPAGSVAWVVGLVGGVGGTVTLLSYGYWIREHGRREPADLGTCRLDLGVAYAATALFGVAMVVIGSRIRLDGSGAGVALALAGQLELALGAPGRWLFLIGFWGAVFSSLLGVWQGVPYLFADLLATRAGERKDPVALRSSSAYRRYQVALALVPMVLLGTSVPAVQLSYAVLGALFMPLLAVTLLQLNTRRRLVGAAMRNGPLVNVGLILTLAFFLVAGWRDLLDRFGG